MATRPTATLVTGGVTFGSSTDGTTSPASASHTPTASRLIVALASTVRGGGTAPNPTLAHSGSLGSLTLGALDVTSNVNIANGGRTRLFTKDSGGSPSAGTYQIDAGGNTQAAWFLHLLEVLNADPTTPIRQVASALANSAGPTTATLGLTPLSDSLMLALWLSENGAAATITGPAASDWGLIGSSDLSVTAPTCRQLLYSCTTSQQAAEFSTSVSCDHLVAILEIAAVAGAVVRPVPLLRAGRVL